MARRFYQLGDWIEKEAKTVSAQQALDLALLDLRGIQLRREAAEQELERAQHGNWPDDIVISI